MVKVQKSFLMGGRRGSSRRCFIAKRVTRVSLSDWLDFQARIRGFENPRLLRDRPADGAALRRNLCWVYRHCVQVTASLWKIMRGSPAMLEGDGAYRAARFCKTVRGTPYNKRGNFGFTHQRVTQISLSDWLAFQARIRVAKGSWLLRNRSADGNTRWQERCTFYAPSQGSIRPTATTP